MARIATTADQRPATGLDSGARIVLMRAAGAEVHDQWLVSAFFEDEDLAGYADYYNAVGAIDGEEAAAAINDMIEQTSRRRQSLSATFAAIIPERDFLGLVEVAARRTAHRGTQATRLNRACGRRGLPYTYVGEVPTGHFEWTGDPVVSAEALQPAASALDDPRLSDGPRTGFDAAAERMRDGAPRAWRQAVGEACNAVESTLKVLCTAHGIAEPKPAVAQRLFDALKKAEVVASETEELVLAASRFGNRRGRHGDGEATQDVSPGEAQAVIASAAVAITYLAGLLPAEG